jgi:hypothetical protein
MSQHVRSVENLPNEVADLAEIASQLVKVDPDTRRAFAELSTVLAAGLAGAGVVAAGASLGAPVVGAAAFSSLPFVVATAARLIAERIERSQRSMALPREERELWEDAGASFDSRTTDLDVVHAAAAFSDLLVRSVDGDAEVASRLGVDRSRISQRIRDKSLYAFTHNDSRFFPMWQFIEGRTLPGLREILAVLDEGLHPLVVDHWFTTPSLDLEIGQAPVSPVTWLSTGGHADVVVELASDL